MTLEEQIWNKIEASNRAWLAGRAHEVEALFHPDVVFRGAGAHVLHGRAAIVESFVEYARHACTEAFEVTEHDVDVVGDVAVVRYAFSVRYVLRADGVARTERGQETLVFQRAGDDWLAIWRTQSSVAA